MSNQPYIGLRPFERNETDIFFGRETHSDELINRLGGNHFLAVIGTSGCGKSSLVKTGLIAGLEAGYLAKAGTHWQIVEMRPGQQPFYALAEKLLLELTAVLPVEETAKSLANKLRQGSLSLHELLEKYPLPNNAQLLLVCDQFEEIFRYFQHGEAAEARNFVSLLLASSKPYPLEQRKVSDSMYIVITMRSDFLGDCAQFAGLAEAINQGLYLTPRLDAQQLRTAIEEPAFVFGGEVEPALVTQLLEDAGNNPDQLPLLQHALMIMWRLAEKAGSNQITMSLYEEIGGLKNALSGNLDRIFEKLSPAQQKITEIMFCALTERADAQRDTRRPLPLAELVELSGASFAEVVAVIDRFRKTWRCFLTPPINVRLTEHSVIDISHESLIRQWQTLQKWVAAEAQAAEKYRHLLESALRYRNKQVGLLQSPELENMLQWQKNFQPTAAWAKRYGKYAEDFPRALAFLKQSAKRRRLKKFFYSVMFVLMTGLAGIASWQWKVAEKHKLKAQQQKELAEKQKEKAEKQQKLAEQGLEDITQFTYDMVQKLSNTTKTQEVISSILEFYISSLEKNDVLISFDKSMQTKSMQTERVYNYISIASLYSNSMGNINKALYCYKRALEINKKIIQQDPSNVKAQKDLSRILENLGDVYYETSQKDKILYEKVFGFAEQNSMKYHNNSVVQESLLYSYRKIGLLEKQRKNKAAAKVWFEKALPIAQKLAEDKMNAKAQEDLKELLNTMKGL